VSDRLLAVLKHMTIHSDFFKIAKENCADAFRDTLPARPDTVFIDGQVKLMKSSTVDLWPVFFRVQFYKTIESCYDMGADTVVLGFDDYNHVPVSKTMTQVKRAKQKVDYEFAHTSSLPSKMPEDWGSAMANRTFKVKVILKVLEVTKQWFESMLATNPAYRDRKLVLDYSGVPTLLKLVSPASARNNLDEYIKQHDWTPKQGTVGRGECDIKAFRWMPVSRCLCIVSTDGDYLPLSLLQTSRQQGDSTQKCNIILHRMTTQLPVTSASKRKFLDEGSVKPTKRTYEFVDIESVCKWIRREFPSKVNDPVVQYCALVALCGCDFARNLPRLGPRTLWVLRHRIQNTNLLDVHQAVCALSIGYLHVFVKKNTLPVGMSNTADWYTSTSLEQAVGIYDNVFTRIHNDQRISPRIKIQLWTGKGVTAHVRNALWTMHYWMLLEHCPDPHSDDFGYVRDAKGRTHFATV
jgi:hypothetical protein